MKKLSEYKGYLMVVAVILLAVVASLVLKEAPGSSPEFTLALQAPSFISVAYAESDLSTSEIGDLLTSEAGISAYIHTSGPINLNLVRSEFTTIETETADYIIGSVALPDHDEEFDTHVYVHVDGWILTYYLDEDVTSKIVDVKASTIASTHLDTIISIVAGAAGYPSTNIQYYDFRSPNAEFILFVAEDGVNGSEFTIELPADYAYFERSWAAYDTSYGIDFYINGSQAQVDWGGDAYNMAYGPISAAQLGVGVPHNIAIQSLSTNYGVLVITYRVP